MGVTPGDGVREAALPTFAGVTMNGTSVPVRTLNLAMPAGTDEVDLLPSPNFAGVPAAVQPSSNTDDTAAPWMRNEGVPTAMPAGSADGLSLQRASDAYFAGDSWMADLAMNTSFEAKAGAVLAVAFTLEGLSDAREAERKRQRFLNQKPERR
jgi:hypothetical protein